MSLGVAVVAAHHIIPLACPLTRVAHEYLGFWKRRGL